ncbi:MAG: tetratricopeptide repeat protein, partial [Bryobacteraceae bacterium]
AEFQAALRSEPNFAEAHNNLGRALSQIPGRLPEAIAEYRAALRIKPDYAQARANLEAACAQNSSYCPKQP